MIPYHPLKKQENVRLCYPYNSVWGDITQIVLDIVERFNVPRKIALEFGVEYGYSTSALANHFESVIGVDTFMGDSHSGYKLESHYDKTLLNLKDFPNIKLVQSLYQDYIKDNDNFYDLIHVDISHDYEHTFACGDWSLEHSFITIFHDTISFEMVRLVVKDLAEKHNREFYNYEHWHGLGILVRK